jgi:hypothetical protein
LAPSNKGFKMLAKLGYKPGTVLGAKGAGGLPEPIRPVIKEDRGGIGRDSDRKRKLAEEVESASKRVRETEDEYRVRVRAEHKEKKAKAQVHAAQRIAEKMDTEAEKDDGGTVDDDDDDDDDGEAIKIKKPVEARPIAGVNVVWREIARERWYTERKRRMRHDLLRSGPRLGTFQDPDEDDDDKLALGKTVGDVAEEELDQDDAELDEFMALPVQDRLERVVVYLRHNHCYCFWCKCQYPDEAMDGCPGMSEEDHD